MANKKISELVEKTNPSGNDELLFLDSSEGNLQKVKLKNLPSSDELNNTDFPFSILGTTGESILTNSGLLGGFSSNTNIKSLHVGSNVKEISTEAFQLSSLSNLTLSEGITGIGQSAFYNQQGGAFNGGIEFPDSLTHIGNTAFGRCSIKGGIKFGQNLKGLGVNAFVYGSNLGRVDIPDSVTQDTSTAFAYSDIKASKIGTGLSTTNIKNMFQGANSLTGIEVSENNPNASSFSGMLLDKNQTTIRFAPRAIGKGRIPGTCTGIDSFAFYRCNTTQGLTFPESVTGIGAGAFYYGTAPTIVNFPSGLKSLGNSAFAFGSPQVVNIPAGSIGSSAFYNGVLKTGTLGTGVTSVGSSTFLKCSNLVTLNCNVPLTSIGTNAFQETNSNLVIHARASDSSWTAGTNLSIKGNTSVDVIKDL